MLCEKWLRKLFFSFRYRCVMYLSPQPICTFHEWVQKSMSAAFPLLIHNFLVVDGYSPPVRSLGSFHFILKPQQQEYDEALEPVIFPKICHFALVLSVWRRRRTSPLSLGPTREAIKHICEVGLCFLLSQSKSLKLETVSGYSVFFHLYVSRCPLWQIAIPHHIRSNLKLPHCFAFLWAELMLNKGRLAERGRGSVIPAGSESHRVPLNTLRLKKRVFDWFSTRRSRTEALSGSTTKQLGIFFVITFVKQQNVMLSIRPFFH